MATSKSHDQIWSEWSELVNMSSTELEDWLATDDSKSVGDTGSASSTGRASGKRIIRLKRATKAALTDDDLGHMAKVVGYINRHLAQGGPAEAACSSKWRFSLMNWGHDPMNGAS